MKKSTILGALLLLSILSLGQTVNDVKRDVLNYCKNSYDLFKPLEWSDYRVSHRKLAIDSDDVDSSIYKSIDRFFKGDTTQSNFRNINKFENRFYFSYLVSSSDSTTNNTLVYGYSNPQNAVGRTSIGGKRYNFILNQNWNDTLYFNQVNKKTIDKNGDTITLVSRMVYYEDLPKKVDYYINSYKIRLVYNALSKGGEVRIYTNTFIVNYKLDGRLSSVFEE